MTSAPPPLRLLALRGLALVGAWLAFGAFFALEEVIVGSFRGMRLAPAELILRVVVGALLWTLLTPLLIWVVRRLDFVTQPSRRHILWLIGLAVAFGILRTVMGMSMTTLIDDRFFSAAGYRRALAINAPWNSFVTFIAAGVIVLIDTHAAARERERLRAELAEAHLQQLRSQLRPHFLFNTLNSIATLVHTDPLAADRMITSLSDLLRASFELGDAPEVPLSVELDFVGKYLEILKTRFGDRLRVETTIAPDALGGYVPTFLLQPLVENAIQHSIAQRKEGGLVAIRAWRDNGRLRMQVFDDGRGFDPLISPRGVGLTNTVTRLEQLYGADHRIEFSPGPDGFTVDLEVPV